MDTIKYIRNSSIESAWNKFQAKHMEDISHDPCAVVKDMFMKHARFINVLESDVGVDIESVDRMAKDRYEKVEIDFSKTDMKTCIVWDIDRYEKMGVKPGLTTIQYDQVITYGEYYTLTIDNLVDFNNPNVTYTMVIKSSIMDISLLASILDRELMNNKNTSGTYLTFTSIKGFKNKNILKITKRNAKESVSNEIARVQYDVTFVVYNKEE